MRCYLPLVVVMCLWGSTFAASKAAVADVPHEVAAFLRFGGGAVVLVAVLGLRSGHEEPRGIAAASERTAEPAVQSLNAFKPGSSVSS
ncbi:EamA family transporter [Gandjariella thermophila]|uniref:EamA domain-containing protein n=1 Tax=Gandjariella thermophila TaxID=1931992 RepID=A0A4D4J3A1_9PSEU|nr:EamA family transporter [Gandjariella thermophila]GDY28473.1 hypothetical protein GTS_01060 [Gandjariella thermophila]